MSSQEARNIDVSQHRIRTLNQKYHSLTVDERVQQLYDDFPADKVMITSSFAATSAFLLHIFSRIAPQQKIFFIDTGYHFPQTLEYKKELTRLFNLDVVDVKAEEWKHEFTQKEQTYRTDPDFCCSINKVEPLDAIKKDYDVWVSGLMRWQSDHRSTLDIFEQRNGIIKFYPLIDVSKKQRDEYIKDHNLPFHPRLPKDTHLLDVYIVPGPAMTEVGDGIIFQKQNVVFIYNRHYKLVTESIIWTKSSLYDY